MRSNQLSYAPCEAIIAERLEHFKNRVLRSQRDPIKRRLHMNRLTETLQGNRVEAGLLAQTQLIVQPSPLYKYEDAAEMLYIGTQKRIAD